MEYLMTYGWAILIIAVVLSVLFYLGVFSGSSFLPQGCIAQSGFLCKAPLLTTGGVLQLQIGEETVQTMNNTNVYFVPQGGTISNASSASIGTLNSAKITNVSIQLPAGSLYPSSYKLGTNLAGTIYLSYTYQGMTLTDEIGTVTVKSVNPSSIMLSSPPATIPSGISTYASVTISNGQTSSTPAPFQQMVQFSEANYANYMTYNGNFANFEFFTSTGSIIPAWIESNNSGTITAWLKLQNGISASNSIQVYLGFASKTTNLLSNTGTSGIGEAPQLSSTYAEYDDGNNVFISYAYATGTVGSSYSNAGEPQVPILISPSTTPFIADALLNPLPSIEGDLNYNPSGSLSSTNVAISGSLRGAGSNSYFLYIYDGNYANGNSFSTITTYGNYIVSTVEYLSTSSWIGYINYNTADTSTISGYSTTFPGSISDGGGDSTYASSAYWLRVRAYPPNGVMPSVSFGGVS